MKKLNKLEINPEKLMQNEELLVIRGGYGWLTCRVNGVICWSASIIIAMMLRRLVIMYVDLGQKQFVLAD